MSTPPAFIKLLAHAVRWGLLQTLTQGDYRVNELVEAMQQPINLVSYHLRRLRDEQLVTTRRSDADGRDIYYTLELSRLRDLFLTAGAELHPILGETPPPHPLSLPPLRVLFVCTHNSARSQMAEGLLRHLSDGQISVYSAGSQPADIHPRAIDTMTDYGIDIRGQQSKHIDRFAGQSFALVVTVCDRAREVCPTFPGGEQIHWSLPDPTAIADPVAQQGAFETIAHALQGRITHLLMVLAQR